MNGRAIVLGFSLLTVVPALAVAVDGAPDPDFQSAGGFVAWSTGTHVARRGTIAPDGAALFLSQRSGVGIYISRVPESGPPVEANFVPSGVTSVLPGQVAFDSSGRLLVVGTATYSGLGQVIFVTRFLYPGLTLDAAFDGDGYFTFDLPENLSGAAIAPVIVPDGIFQVERLVVGGNVFPASGADLSDIIVLRLTHTGGLDTDFGGGDGWVRHDFDLQTNLLADLAIDSQDRIVLGGTIDPFADADGMVARTQPNGTLDGGFGIFGWTRLEPVVDPVDELVAALTLAGDDTIWTAGVKVATGPARQQIVLHHLDAGGTDVYSLGGFALPTRFDVAGVVHQGDGRVIVFGDTDRNDGDSDLFVTACRPEGASPCAFELAFGPLDADHLSYPLADLTSGGDEFAGGLALAGGRPILFADAETATNRKAVVVRLENAYIFVDGFESASPAYW
ncbi:MAG: hypothetical protein KBA72_16135 [Thermoanaerobaculia bacterium]|nr:hypothetical protein [Thermoanaerobaculia bacterium]